MTADDSDRIEPNETGSRVRIRSLFDGLSGNFEDRYAQLVDMRREFEEELAAALQAPLNEYISHQPQQSFVEKSELASHVNQLLRGVGLAIQDPGSAGKAGMLMADTKSAQYPDVTRFRLSISDGRNKTLKLLSTRGPLPPLTLVPDNPGPRWWTGHRSKGSDGPGLG